MGTPSGPNIGTKGGGGGMGTPSGPNIGTKGGGGGGGGGGGPIASCNEAMEVVLSTDAPENSAM